MVRKRAHLEERPDDHRPTPTTNAKTMRIISAYMSATFRGEHEAHLCATGISAGTEGAGSKLLTVADDVHRGTGFAQCKPRTLAFGLSLPPASAKAAKPILQLGQRLRDPACRHPDLSGDLALRSQPRSGLQPSRSAWPRSERPSQEITIDEVVKWHDVGPRPFVGSIFEDPLGAVFASMEVGDCAATTGEEEVGKAASAGIELLGELPGELEQMGEQVVSLVGPE